MHDCFEPKTKYCFYSENQILIIDGHASNISTKFIQFVCKHKIVCLCLSSYSIYLLQPLNIGILVL